MAQGDGLARRDRPFEQEAVKTTIVGGRPPGSGKPVGPIPRGIEVLIKKAAVDAEFKHLLLEKRAEAAREIGLALDPAEALMLKAAPADQLEAIIARTTVAPSVRAAFLGRAAAVMLVALGAGTTGCSTDGPTPSGPSTPTTQLQPATPPTKPAETAKPPTTQTPEAQPKAEPVKTPEAQKSEATPTPPEKLPVTYYGVRPAKPADTQPPATEPKPALDSAKPTGIRPDRPEPKPAPAPEQAPKAEKTQPPAPMAGVAPDVPRQPRQDIVEPAPKPPQPDPEPPRVTGIRPDKPQARSSGPGAVLILADAEQPPTPPPGPPAPTGVRPDRPPAKADEPTFTGIQPDRPPVTKGTQPDRPPAKPSEGEKKVVVTALKVPQEWNEAKLIEVLAAHLKALADKSLPDNRMTAQNEDATRRIRIQWKARQYDVPLPDAGPDATVKTRKEIGPGADGLILVAWLENQLDLENRPKVLDNAGLWETRADQVYVLPMKKCLKFDVHWGARTDRQLVALFSTPLRWFEGEEVTSQTYVPPTTPTTTPSQGVTRGVRPDRPLPKEAQPKAPDATPGPTTAPAKPPLSASGGGARPEKPPIATEGGVRPDRPAEKSE